MIATIILAAGSSSRMNKPKALLQIGESTFAETIARKAHEAGSDYIAIITGAHYQEIKSQLKGIDILFHPRYREGQLSSLKLGLRNLPTGFLQALVWPVDHPLVQVDTIRKLISFFREKKTPVTIPVFRSSRGHPVLYDMTAIQTVLGFSQNQTAKDLIAVFSQNLGLVDVDDSGVLIDIDMPEDYEKEIIRAGL